ncbi:hypothetical protein KSS87_002065 [Heliosperma pusillum]|nr:hypothetical protein KSS87_002065 [Heliosperma pusillum]
MAVACNFATNSLSRPISLLPPSSPFSKSFNFSFFLSPPSSSLFLSTKTFSLPNFRASVLRSPGNSQLNDDVEDNFEGEDEDEEFVEYEGYESEATDENFVIDEDELETEARVLVQEFSRSLSRELIIEDEVKVSKEAGGKQKRQKPVTKSIPDHRLPKVAIVGRPNVGKSALFNRLVGGNRAIVVDEPGVTRDRLYGRSYWGENEFMVIDTGGVVTLSKSQEVVVEDLNVSTTIGMEGIPLAAREAAVAKMPSQIERQAAIAVEESSVVIFLVDGQAGLTAGDVEIGDWLRKNYSDKSIILAVNKCESPGKGQVQALEFWSFGFSPLPISAISGTGTGELLDLVCSSLTKVEEPVYLEEEENYVPAMAIVGRPNVGKSSILNALVGEDRTIVSPVSGTTRDAIDTEFTGPDGQRPRLVKKTVKYIRNVFITRLPHVTTFCPFSVGVRACLLVTEPCALLNHFYGKHISVLYHPLNSLLGLMLRWIAVIDMLRNRNLICLQKFRLIDTAGIRRKSTVASCGSTTEALSVNRAFRAIRRSDVVALVIEAMACITEQDYKIAERIEMEGKASLIVVNKWDTIPNKNQETATIYEQDVRRKLRNLHWAPIVYATAITGQSIDKIIVAANIVEKERSRRLSTATLNQVVREAVAFKAPPQTRGGKRGRVLYCTQAAIRPPTFVFFVNEAKLFPDTYRRYMEKQLRSDAGFSGTPIRLLWRSRRKSTKDSGSSNSTTTRPKLQSSRKKEAIAA